MESLKELYKIGNGPSSSHTMGPKKAAERFAERSRDVDSYRVTLYGSLAATGKGHLTDMAILSVLGIVNEKLTAAGIPESQLTNPVTDFSGNYTARAHTFSIGVGFSF